MQKINYKHGMDRFCRKIHDKYHYEYDLNAIFPNLAYTRVLEPGSKHSSPRDSENLFWRHLAVGSMMSIGHKVFLNPNATRSSPKCIRIQNPL